MFTLFYGEQTQLNLASIKNIFRDPIHYSNENENLLELYIVSNYKHLLRYFAVFIIHIYHDLQCNYVRRIHFWKTFDSV